MVVTAITDLLERAVAYCERGKAMSREMLPRFRSGPKATLRGFECGNCLWSYSCQDGQSDYWQFLADARVMFDAHDCKNYQQVRSVLAAPHRNGMTFVKCRCADCDGTGSTPAGKPCTNCEGTGLVSMANDDQIAS